MYVWFFELEFLCCSYFHGDCIIWQEVDTQGLICLKRNCSVNWIILEEYCKCMMIGSGNNLNRGSAFLPSNMPSLPQCIPLEPITLGNQKNSCSGELKRALGVSSGNAFEDRPFGVVHLKRQPPVASKELKHFKDSVQDSSRRAR